MSAQTIAGSPKDCDVLQPGTALNGYTIERKLGQGGFGIVYLARHNDLQRAVAIKEFLPVELAARDGHSVRPRNLDCQEFFDDGLRRFLEEAKRLIQFRNHPNIVSCTDFFRSNGTAYLVMEYEDAVPLSRLLREREVNATPFGEADLIALIKPLLGALSQIHSAGVLHRDVKPSNILVRHEGQEPVLIDFGAAKQMVSGHTKSMAPYTDGYAALEQVGNGKLGPWTDMYAIGAVMWRIVASGNPPWEPPEPVKVENRASAEVYKHQDPLPSAQTLGAGRFSLDVLRAIDRCLRLNGSDRVQTSDELMRLFRQQSLPGQGASDGPGQPSLAAETTKAKNAPLLRKVRSTRPELTRAGWAIAAFGAVAMGTWLTLDRPQPFEPHPEEAAATSPSTSPTLGQEKSSFTVTPVPSSATVSFVDSRVPYEHGMALGPGTYRVRVTAPGYEEWSGIVGHGAGRTVKRVRLQKEGANADETAANRSQDAKDSLAAADRQSEVTASRGQCTFDAESLGEEVQRNLDDPSPFYGFTAYEQELPDEIGEMYYMAFGSVPPVTAMGSTPFHRGLGLDHTGRIDVGLHPDSEEGMFLAYLLENFGIDYIAFRTAVPGQSTGPLIHIGPPSDRIEEPPDRE